MSSGYGVRELLLPLAFATFAFGCATPPAVAPERAAAAAAEPEPLAVLRSVRLDSALEERILALDPERITAEDVRDTLSKAPAPRIVLLHGGAYPVHIMMVSAGEFFTGMGYPENKIRHPGDQRWSHSPYEPSTQIAGAIAWYYEHDGMRPMMIGHSQGGIQAVKVLYELVGRYQEAIPVWNPLTDSALARTKIRDPLTGVERPVIGLTVSYVSVVGAGGAALLLPNQWSMIGYVHTIPDSVEDFTGFSVGLDIMAWTVPGIDATTEFEHNGTAQVRSVTLPLTYNHLTVTYVDALASHAAARAWIEAYVPGETTSDPPSEPVGYGILWAADVWHSVKKHWALEAQRLIRARRAALGPS